MNRNYYCKVNSQEEANKLLKLLSNIDESILTTTTYIENSWNIVGFHESKWCLLDSSYLKKDFIKVPTSELIDYVTGKKVDKDALLEEAKRRYPIGTKFKVVHSPKNIRKVISHEKHSNTFVTASDGLHINLISELIEGEKSICISASVYFNGKWAEIVEEPKVETKFEVGKWYHSTDWGRENDYIKFSNFKSPTTFYFTEKIHGGVYSVLNDFWSCKENIIKEVSLQEIQQYLPADHPDKIKQEVKEEVKPNITWKIGDYVVFTEDWCRSRKGDIDKIEKLGNEVIALYLGKEGLAGSPLHEECKLKVFSTLQEAQKFSDELLGKSKTNLNEGNLMGSKEYPEYYECISIDSENFTKGKIYKILNPEDLEAEYNFIDDLGGKNGWSGRNYKHFKPSTREAYEAQFKKDEKFTDGDWLVYIKDCGLKPSYPIKIGDIKQMLNGSFGTLAIYGYADLSYCFRKALPHEIPENNSNKQNPLTFEECGKFPDLTDFENEVGAYIQKAQEKMITGYLEQIKLNWNLPEKPITAYKKSPDLMDRTKVKVEIKRTKTKQIKL